MNTVKHLDKVKLRELIIKFFVFRNHVIFSQTEQVLRFSD